MLGFGHTVDTDIIGIRTALDIYKQDTPMQTKGCGARKATLMIKSAIRRLVRKGIIEADRTTLWRVMDAEW